MATWANGTKNASTFTNDQFGSAGRTWNEAMETWNESPGTWANPYVPFTNATKNSSTFTNGTKN